MITFKTNMGDIKIELDFESTPISPKNFLKYCQQGFYEGTIFHRVIKGFMIQGIDIVKSIEKVKTGSKGDHDDVPKEPIIVEKVIVSE